MKMKKTKTKMMDNVCFISEGIYSKVTNPCPMVMNNNCLYSQKSSCDTNSAYFYMLIKVILEIFKQQQNKCSHNFILCKFFLMKLKHILFQV